MIIRSLFKTFCIYVTLILVVLFVYYLLNGIHNKMYSVRGLPYLYINSLFLLNCIFVVTFSFIIGDVVFSTRKIYKNFLNKEIKKKISKKTKLEVTLDELHTYFQLCYNDNNIKFNTLKNIISLPFFIFIIIFLFFFIAITIEMFFAYHNVQDKLSYIAILFFWTIIFTLLFLYSRIFFYTLNREIYIYLILLILYITSLLLKHKLFDNIFFFYTPYNDECLNFCAREDLYERFIKYSEYIIDWSLIQGTLIAILTCFNFTNKKYREFKKLIESDKNEYKALLDITCIVEEIYSDEKFKKLCKDISKNKKNYDFYLYKEKILDYHNQISKIYSYIENSNYKWIFDKFSIRFLLSKTYINKCINVPTKKKFCVCNSCKKFFFSISTDKLCKNCKKEIIL